MNKKIKVAMVTNHLGVMGISAVIMNYSKAIDPNKYEITIIAGDPIAEQYVEECLQFGIKIVKLPSRHQSSFKHYLSLFNTLRSERFDVVHVHGNSSLMAVELTLAKLAGVKVRIAHSHNSTCPNLMIHKVLNSYFNKIYTKSLSCGILAGEWLFGKNNFEVLPNSFYTSKFKFDLGNREKIRSELGISDKIVIGHIGRFNEQKNQKFLLQIFETLAATQTDTVLLLVGSGPNFEKIKYFVDNHPYKDRIILYGVAKEPNILYSAMDIFVLPSLYEGLPVVLLEAQISGLPSVVSDSVTREMDFGKISWLSLDSNPQVWADEIVRLKNFEPINRDEYYESNKDRIQEYDIEISAKQLEKIYSENL